MELKFTNHDGEIFLENKLNHVQFFLEKLLKLSLRTNPIHYFLKNLQIKFANQEASSFLHYLSN